MVQTRSARKAAASSPVVAATTSPPVARTRKSVTRKLDLEDTIPDDDRHWITGYDGLFPTVAISDCFMGVCHVIASHTAYAQGAHEAAAGFALVALANFVGVLRFGYSETYFATVNGDLADLAAYVGLPLVGHHFASEWPLVQPYLPSPFPFVVGCAAILTLRKSAPDAVDDACRVLFNVLCFVAPVAVVSYQARDWTTFAGIVLFLVAAVPIGPDRHSTLLGVRRENIFHYALGVSALLLAHGG